MYEHRSEIIRQLNNEKISQLIPVIAYMSILASIGFIGNILVIFIYRTRVAKSSSSYFVLCLAVLDLLTCAIGMPFDIVDLVIWYDFKFPAICKTMRFVTYFTVMASGVTLIIVAFDRYFKICKPLMRFPVKVTKFLIAVAICIGLMFSWPALLLFGDSNIDLPNYNISATQCSVETYIKKTVYPRMYYSLLGCIFIVCTVFLCVLYACLLSQLKEQSRRMSRTLSGPKTEPKCVRLDSLCPDISSEHNSDGNLKKTKHHTKRQIKQRQDSRNKNKSTSSTTHRTVDMGRTTAIFLAISCVFILSYLPALILVILRSVIKEFEDDMSPAVYVAYEMFLRSYFISNAVNPFIYGFMNPRFRNECSLILGKIYQKTCCCCFDNKVQINDRNSDSLHSHDMSHGSIRPPHSI